MIPLFLISATIFTLYSLPSNQGFGFGSSSLAAISSQVLQAFTVAVIINDGVFKKKEVLRGLLMEISPIIAKKKDVKERLLLKYMIQNLEECLAKDGQVDVIQFSLDHNVAAVAKELSSSISKANDSIKKKFISLYQ